MPNALKPRDPAKMHLILMLVLTFSTGIIDAVGYLGLDRVFTGNMTGNVVILGMALMGADGLPVLGPSIALVGFVAGAAIAGRVLKSESAGWSRRTTVLIAVVGACLALTAIGLFAGVHHAAQGAALSITGFIAAAMGLQAGTARHLAVKDVTTVVVTSTLTGLAADSPLGGGGRQVLGAPVAGRGADLAGCGRWRRLLAGAHRAGRPVHRGARHGRGADW
ncbi:YoaK family protein [Glutamicibacter halophytocola]|uniref:YoaK family protein n=1 Tax=Glutamicibacter halophytocola TaxID=1933880 RepID=UPI00321BA3BE